MAEEPQPAGVQPGSSEAAIPDAENPGLKPASKDDAKAAAALDKLDSRGGDGDDAGKGPSAADASKLSSAMSSLKVGGGDGAKANAASEAAAAKKKIKIDAKDVSLIVEHCDLRKDKATELLRNNEGDLAKALSAYVTGAA